MVTITKKNGSTHDFLYDAIDEDRIRAHTWWVNPHGYAYTDLRVGSTSKDRILLHRFILELGDAPEIIVDHLNGDTADNRRANLRPGDSQANAVNRARRNGKGSSQYRGVSWDRSRQRWAAHVGLNYKLHHLGRFTSEEAAAAAVAAFRREQGLPEGY